MANATFTDIGAVTVHDTDGKGTKRRSKSGDPYHAGSGTITINGTMYKVYCSVRKGGRPGTLVAGLSLITDESPSTPVSNA